MAEGAVVAVGAVVEVEEGAGFAVAVAVAVGLGGLASEVAVAARLVVGAAIGSLLIVGIGVTAGPQPDNNSDTRTTWDIK